MLLPVFDTHLSQSSIAAHPRMASWFMVRTTSKGKPPGWAEAGNQEWLCKVCNACRQTAKQSQPADTGLSPGRLFAWGTAIFDEAAVEERAA